MDLQCKGFSLIEILVALGIVGLIAVAGTTLMTQNFTQMALIEAKQNLGSLVMDTQTMLMAKKTCDPLIGSDNTYDKTKAEMPYLLDPDDPKSINTAGGLSIAFHYPEGDAAAGSQLKSYKLAVESIKLYGAKTLATSATGELVQAQIVGFFTPSNPLVSSRAFSPRMLGTAVFEVDTGTNKIISCFDLNGSDNPEDINELVQLQCEALGGTYDSSTDECDLVASLCARLGGTYSNGQCTLVQPATTTTTTTTTTAPPPPPKCRDPYRGTLAAGQQWPHGRVYTASPWHCQFTCVMGVWVFTSGNWNLCMSYVP